VCVSVRHTVMSRMDSVVARVASLCWVVQRRSLKAERSMPDGNKGLAANGQPEG
jgi:hypothetical protein